MDNSRIEFAQDIINNATYLCTFGLSLGLSDLTWRENIISWLERIEGHQLFVYDYTAFDQTDLDDDERLDFEDDLKKKLFSNWRINVSSKLWNQIHMPCGNKIFNYKEVIDNYIINNYSK